MPKRLLPLEGTPEFQQITDAWQSGEEARIDAAWRACRFKNRASFKRQMNELGVKQAREMGSVEVEPFVINLPEIKLHEYKPDKKKRRGDEEVVGVLLSDGHAGKITPAFDEDVYMESMDTLFYSIMTIVSLHRNMYPLRKIYLFKLGDNVQGENPYQGSTIGSVKMGERDQIAKLAFPAHIKLTCSLRQEFEEVIEECIGGNHGYERFAPETSRADLRLYDQIASKLSDRKGITINTYENFSAIVEVFDFKFFLFHGDGIPCQQGVPFFALDRRLKAWHMQYGGFDYAFGGHFHKRHSDEISSVVEYLMNSTLVSQDDWALKKMGISSEPSQWIFGIHPRRGVTWRYPLIVDKSKYKLATGR